MQSKNTVWQIKNIMTLIVVFMLQALLLSPVVNAGWLDKGKELLKGVTTESAGGTGGLGSAEIAAGLKEALTIGSDNVVKQLGQEGGFNRDPAVHIPLPGKLKKVKSTLGKLGMGDLLEDLELKMNSAAEAATPKAKQLFVDAIREMTLDDARQILNGSDDAATRYFQSKMSPSLAQEMTPVVNQSLAEVGAIKSYDSVMKEYEALPLVPDVKANMSEYVVQKAMDGVFHYLAVEEAAIRQNPARRTTELLKKVFGG